MGDNFSPDQLEEVSGLTLINKEERNSLGKYGRYKDEPIPRGSAMIEGDDLDEILILLSKNHDTIQQNGVTEIILTATLTYTDQCNWEFSQKQLRFMVDMKISFSVTCYEKKE